MEITFKNKKLQKICNSEKKLLKTYGKNCARKIRARLDDLQAAPNLEAFKTLPGRCHELIGDKKGLLSLDLEHPLRLIFEPTNKSINKKDGGGINWNLVNAIKIINVEDTHD
ncbi:MAG: type II toxin-antitoxin system RelE/ParE family toxin [Gammaproteobacteria bacterium]|jgi:proteic killer suppression protein